MNIVDVRPDITDSRTVVIVKSIEQTIVIEAVEQAIQSVAKKNMDKISKSSIDEKTGEIKINKYYISVNEIEAFI